MSGNQDQRASYRFSERGFTVKIAGNDVPILDVSYGGISVLLKDVPSLAPGQTLDVILRELPIPSIIRDVTPLPNSGYRVGLQWQYATLPSSTP